MNVDLDKHNARIDRIIADEQMTLGVSVPVGRMMRADIEVLLRLVAGHASAMELRVQQLSVEREELIDKVDRLEVVG